MKVLQSSAFRALCATITGILLIKYPDHTVKGLTMAIGGIFLISGIIACVTYFWQKRHVSEYKIYDAEGHQVTGDSPTFPLAGMGSVILGAILALMPTAFDKTLMYVIGMVLVLGALNQYMSLFGGRRYGRVGLVYWILPTLVLLIGLYAMLKPMETLAMPLLILGWCCLVYGATELINSLKFYRNKKRLLKEQEQQQDSYEEIEN
jgi:uncharacterized membrane protein HdeD (DUF308 family)